MIKTPSTLATGAPAPITAPFAGSGASEGDAAMLDFERFDVYRVALEFQGDVAALSSRADGVVRDQLRRASLSILLNIAEGVGQRSRPQKRNLYGIARGSAMECAAIIDVVRIRGLASAVEASRARGLLVRVVQMLTRLDRRLS